MRSLKRGTEQFYRGDKSRHSATNYGLGLYNSWKIMLLHNGRIILENNSDKHGAKCKVRITITIIEQELFSNGIY